MSPVDLFCFGSESYRLTIRMKNCQFLTIFLCLPIQVMPWVFHVKNMTSLHSNYLDHCDSGFLCSEMNKTNASTSESSEKQNCPVCLCTHDCEVKGQCCPDKSLSKCIQPDYFLNQKYYVESDRFMMVSACPQRYRYLEDDCLLDLNPSSFQHLAPVISLKTNITYANAKCAKCHGESEFIEWPSSVICFQKDFDINIYSDVDGLWAGMKEHDCVLEYFPPPGSSLALCEIRSLVSECNVTGEWDVYDEDVETACKNYWNQYGVFQNVFCFLCNTGVDQRKLYRTQYNIYKGNMTIQQDFFDEGVTIIEEWNKFNKQYKAKLTLLSLDVLENVKQMLKERNQTSDSKISENLVNMTALFTEYVRSGGYQDWCQEDHQVQKIHPGFRSRRNCTCDQNCYKSASCCPDAAYNHTMACFLPFLGQKDDPKPNEAFFVISRCPKQYEDVFIKSNCEKSLDFEIFDIPVINVQTNEAYKNHYCYLCHHQEDIFKNTTTEIKAWNITIVCPSLLFPMFVPSIALLLQAAKSKQCFIYFTTIFHLEFCDENNFSIIQKCNATGMVESVSQDVLTMCEDPLMNIMAKSRNYLYKNQICDVCNTEVYEEPLGVCTDPDFDYLGTICEYGELDLDYYPYENIFCMQCNPFDKGGGKLDPVSGMRSYRNIFSIFDTEETDEQTTTECKESEFLDVFTKTCRKLYCSPGKYLQDSSCQFFITETQLVSYTMAFKISIFSNSSESNIYSILENLKKFIQPEITEGYIEFIDYYFYSNKPCNELKISLQNLTIEEEAMIYLQMLIISSFPDSLNRTITEEQVMNLPKLTINLQGVSLTFQESLEAWYIPFMYNRKTTKSCLERTSIPAYESKTAFDVNNLLTCTQIQLERNEYNFLGDGIRVYIPAIKKQFEINEYIKSSNGSIRICSDSYKFYLQSFSESVMQTILNILTYICTVISLVSLSLTIFIYCLLTVLRTLPGKIIMCFMFSLFFAQLLFLIQSHVKDKLWCSWVGGLTHYFWVSVFTCTNISSFHMFKLFVTNSLLHGNQSAERKLFFKYCCVAFCSPALPVGLNLILDLTAVQSFRFGYGGSKCFLASPMALLLLFILPVVLQISFNVIMFSITFHYIRSTPKLQNSKDRDEFSIFLKLFLLTGISWLLIIIDGFFEVSLFSFLATIVNGSQGVFLLISYVCNRKVFDILKNNFFGTSSGIAGSSTNRSFLSDTRGSSTRFSDKKGKIEKKNTLITKI